MSETSLKERVEQLEKKVATLLAEAGRSDQEKDWQSTFGMSENDPGFEEMIRLGSEYRKRAGEGSGQDAGS